MLVDTLSMTLCLRRLSDSLPQSYSVAETEMDTSRQQLFRVLVVEGTMAHDEAAAYAACSKGQGEPYEPPLKPFLAALLGSEGIHTGVGSTSAAGVKEDWVKMVQLMWLLTNPQQPQEPQVRQALLAMLAKHNSAWAGLSAQDLQCLAQCMERVHLYGPFDFLGSLGVEVSAGCAVCCMLLCAA